MIHIHYGSLKESGFEVERHEEKGRGKMTLESFELKETKKLEGTLFLVTLSLFPIKPSGPRAKQAFSELDS